MAAAESRKRAPEGAGRLPEGGSPLGGRDAGGRRGATLPAGAESFAGSAAEDDGGAALLARLKAAFAVTCEALPMPPVPPPPRTTSASSRCRERYRRARCLWEDAERSRLVINEFGAPSASRWMMADQPRRVTLRCTEAAAPGWRVLLR